MSWIKRNLYFLIFGVIALVLLGLSGWYFYSQYARNNEILAKLTDQYQTLQKLNTEKPHPGSGEVDNIQAAKNQRAQLTNYLAQARKYFERIPPIPNTNKVASQDFTAALRRTLDQLQRDAAASSVLLPPEGGGYSFSFAAEKQRMTFASNSLAPLSIQLGEVKAICDVLFQANINAIDNLRRERVSADDAAGPVTDYVSENSVSNDLAVITHYELTIRCFSSELASVLAGFASSPYCLLVSTINVELASAAPVAVETGPASGIDPNVHPGGPGGGPSMTLPPGAAQPLPSEPRGGLPTVLDERQLRVTLGLNVLKLLPPK